MSVKKVLTTNEGLSVKIGHHSTHHLGLREAGQQLAKQSFI